MEPITSGCRSCDPSRRNFLKSCAAAGAGVLGLAAPAAGGAPGKAKVGLVFSYAPSTSPIWPFIGYDFDRRKAELSGKLLAACPEVEFLPFTAQNGDEAKKVLAEAKDVDGYLVYMLGIWCGAPAVFAASGKPVLFVDDLYGGSGEFLIDYAAARRSGQKVAGISSSRIEDVADAARCFSMLKDGASAEAFVAACTEKRKKATPAPGDVACKPDPVKTMDVERCLRRVRGKTLLAVGGGWGMPARGKAVEEVLGIKVVPIDFPELHQAYLAADKDEAATWADRWMKLAEKVIEPNRDVVLKSAAMYLGMREVLRKREAHGITINCLGGFYGGHLQAYPCLGFTELNDNGMVGGCEGDINSAVTMMTVGTLTGRPGMISDPVIDTSTNRIIYAHCVAPTQVFGPLGTPCPYHIRSHSEDRKGAVVRSLLPLGYKVTTLEIDCEKKAILVHQGKSVEDVDEDKACRSKLAAEVHGDLDRLLTQWDQWGWHRVTFFGDIKPQVVELARALGLKVVEEA